MGQIALEKQNARLQWNKHKNGRNKNSECANYLNEK